MAYEPRPMKDVLAGVAKGTGAGARRVSQEELDAARVRASGVNAKPGYRDEQGVARYSNPAFQEWAKGEMLDRARRTVMGLYENKGRYPMHTLSHGQFAQFKETGTWEGMPTPEEYGPHSVVPEDKEYTPIGEA
jgi:hypothetical protein